MRCGRLPRRVMAWAIAVMHLMCRPASTGYARPPVATLGVSVVVCERGTTDPIMAVHGLFCMLSICYDSMHMKCNPLLPQVSPHM